MKKAGIAAAVAFIIASLIVVIRCKKAQTLRLFRSFLALQSKCGVTFLFRKVPATVRTF